MIPISAEFFPAKTKLSAATLQQTIASFQELNLDYMSVTYGAGGTSQQGTLDTILLIKKLGGVACPHITCIGTTKNRIIKELIEYKNYGINQIVALRGDLPDSTTTSGDFNFASELVDFIKKEFGDYFKIHIAAYPEKHPESPDFYSDFNMFKNKIIAGANSAITQYFYNTDAYAHFLDECAKQQITIPIVPGIMPITNYHKLANFSKNCGAEIPRWLATRLESFGDNLIDLQKFGIEIVINLCEDLIKIGAPSLHFYSMNKIEPSRIIINNL